MARPICLRCISRSLPYVDSPLFTPRVARNVAAFSTSLPRLANATPKKNPASPKTGARASKTLVLKKGQRASTGRAPAPGERKAQRKRVVLNNPNALDVPGLEDLSPGSLAEKGDGSGFHRLKGQVLGLPNETVEALTALETFKPTQRWKLFKRPATLIRDDTVDLLQQLVSGQNRKEAVRQIVYGEQGSGKSVHVLQAQAMALLKSWVVIHIPDANEVTNGHSAFQPLRTKDGLQYIQPQYTARLLSNIARANQAVLQDLTISQQHTLPIPIQSNISLSRLAELGARDEDLAWPIWTALWTELTTKSANGIHRPPILFSADGVDHLMRESAYIDTNAEPIHAFDLSLVSHLVELLCGRMQLPNGGMVIAAVGQSNRASTPTFDHCLDVLQSKQYPSEQTKPPRWDPFVKKDARVAELAERGVGVLRLDGLNKQEARGIMEYYAKSGILRGNVTDSLVSEKWSITGGGIVGQLERASVAMY